MAEGQISRPGLCNWSCGNHRDHLVGQPDIGMTALILVTWGFQMFLAGMPMLFVISAAALTPLGFFIAYLSFLVQLRVDKFFEGALGRLNEQRELCGGGYFGVGRGMVSSATFA